ncbi:MAG: GNAT family N-acetyltransferase [Pseudomonadota bacterium]
MPPITVQPLTATDRPALLALVREHWGEERIVSRGRAHDVRVLEGLVARGTAEVGFALYRREGAEAELVLLHALPAGHGLGTALVEALVEHLAAAGVARLWLITTNDNLDALRFYQRRGFSLVAVHRRALDRSRLLKPSIPLTGPNGIPLRDEIELERLLVPAVGS